MNALVTYYSRTGTTRKVAEKIAMLLECDSEEIVDTKNRSGMIGWLKSGRDAGNKVLTKIEKLDNDPASYEIVIIGTPNWHHTLSTPIRTYLTQYKDHFKEVAFFCTGDSVDDTPFGEMELLCGKKPVATLRLHRKSQVEANQYEDKAKEFVNKIAARAVIG